MRKWFTSLAVLGLISATAIAQTLGPAPPIGGCNQSQSLFYDDGTAEVGWKVSWPTQPNDSWSCDFDDLAGNMDVTGIAMSTFMTGTTAPSGIKYLALCPDNLVVDSLGHTPDLANPMSVLGTIGGTTVGVTGNPGASAGFCPGLLVYDTPDVAVPTTGGAHAVTTFITGDSVTWICGDLNTSQRHNFFSFNNFSTPALSTAGNVMLRLVGTPNNSSGSASFTINNSAGNVVVNQVAFVDATLWSTAATQPTLYLQGAFFTGFGFIPAPNLVMQTGLENFSPITDLTQGSLCGDLSDPSLGPCVPAGLNFGFGAFYIDNADLKKNGNGKIKLTNQVNVSIVTAGPACNPCYCFGVADDGSLDGFIWKINNPSTSKDYFNVKYHHANPPGTGALCTVPNEVTEFEIASWDFCGSGPSWQSIGLYGANTVLDSTGGTPDLSVTGTITTATSLTMAPGAANFSFPATVYDCPNVFASTNATLANSVYLHGAASWPTGDTCIWIASDTDGVDDDATSFGTCSVAPSTTSYLSSTAYTTPAIPFNGFTGLNWMMHVNWN